LAKELAWASAKFMDLSSNPVGHVKIYSELGEGTAVKIYLPRIHSAMDAAEEEEEVREPAQGDGKETILVAEDDEDVRTYLIETLRDLNYRALRAIDAVSALGLLEQIDIRIDLLLTDVILPGMNGRELAKKAQSIRPNLRVLFMTGYSRNAIVHQGRLDPGVELIQKPISQEQLAARIRGSNAPPAISLSFCSPARRSLSGRRPRARRSTSASFQST
jgi:CheY-like chemotaxis protein